MRFCYNCGKQVEDNVLICPDCGALVKRYTEDMDKKDIPLSPEEQAQQPEFKGRIYVDENGKTRIRGLLKAWIILTCVIATYVAFSLLCLLIVYGNQAEYLQILPLLPEAELALFGGYEALLSLWNELMGVVSQIYGYLIAVTALTFIKAASDIWLLCSKKKIAFVIRQGSILLAAVLLLLIQNPGFAIAFTVDGFVTSMLLGKDKFNLL